MNIIIEKHISSRVYKTKQTSFGLISDELTHIHYFLKGAIADLWDVILRKNDYTFALEYAKQNNMEKELKQLLSELKQKKFINISMDLPFLGYKYLTSFVNRSKKLGIFDKCLNQLIYKNNSLITLILQLNYDCNLKCKHCFNPKNKMNEQLDFEICKKAIDEADELGVIEISMTGGECTINKDFLKIAKYIRSKHISLSFLTNGQKLYDDKNLLKEIINLHPFRVELSLYSMNPEIHDCITGQKGSHFKTLNVIKKLRKANIKIMVNCPVLTINKNDYKDISAFAKEWDITLITGCIFINNPDNCNDYLKADSKTTEEFYIDKIKEEGNIRANSFINDNKAICNFAGRLMLNIAPNLDITPCNDFNYPLGNFKTNSLKSIRENALPGFIEKFSKSNLKECFKEDYCEYCFYCPKILLYSTKELGKFETFCEQAKAYEKALNKLDKTNNKG